MKIGIVSDTHGMKKYIDKTIPYLKDCDLIIHAGDNFSDSKYIHSATNVGILAVRGNCDFDNVEDELIFNVEDKNIFLCHGDRYSVEYGLSQIEDKAKSVGADIVVFGHTHVPLEVEKDDIIYINPGSTSLPREVKDRSFKIMYIENNSIKIEMITI